MVGGGGGGASASQQQYRSGSTGGSSSFQPSGSYNGAGSIIAYGGGGTPAGIGYHYGTGGGHQAQGGLGFSGHDGQRVRYGTGGEHGISEPGRGGASGHGDNTHGKGAQGIKSFFTTNGNGGGNGFVYIIEYIGT